MIEPSAVRKKMRVGTVVSDKMTKTISVLVERRVLHPQFKKYLSRRKKYLVHDEKEEAGMGDKVEIIETRPLSRRKCWKLNKILTKGTEASL